MVCSTQHDLGRTVESTTVIIRNIGHTTIFVLAHFVKKNFVLKKSNKLTSSILKPKPKNRGIRLATTEENSCGWHRFHGACYTIDWGPSRKWDGGELFHCDTRTSNTGRGPYIRSWSFGKHSDWNRMKESRLNPKDPQYHGWDHVCGAKSPLICNHQKNKFSNSNITSRPLKLNWKKKTAPKD